MNNDKEQITSNEKSEDVLADLSKMSIPERRHLLRNLPVKGHLRTLTVQIP